jgi:hypothetical protein
MVSTDEALESKYITADLVKASPTKKLVVVGQGSYEQATFDGETSRRLTIPVQIDSKDKLWRPNKDSVTNLRAAYGSDTASWVGKTAKLQTIRIQGKDSILATAE